jgi:hypothetical protein
MWNMKLMMWFTSLSDFLANLSIANSNAFAL